MNLSKSRPAQPAPKQTLPKEKCERCRQMTHTIKTCRAGPPKKTCYCRGSHWLYKCLSENSAQLGRPPRKLGPSAACWRLVGQCCSTGDARPRVTLNIHGIQCTTLIDTGSTHTLVHQRIYEKLPKLIPLYAAPPAPFHHRPPASCPGSMCCQPGRDTN